MSVTDDADTVQAPENTAVIAGNAATVDSTREYLRMSIARLRSGDTGILPVIIGLIVLSVIFQSMNSKFLTATNLVNLLAQGAVYVMLAFGVVFVLLLGEIDLSAGWVLGVGGSIAALVLQNGQHPWWLAVLAAIGATTAIGLLQGSLIALIGLPSFVVTLAGFLAWEGVVLLALGHSGSIGITDATINDFNGPNNALSATASWIVFAVLAVVGVGLALFSDVRRRRSGLATPPLGLTIAKLVVAVVLGFVLLLICNHNRGRFVTIKGVPYLIPIVIAFLLIYTFVLQRTRFGRYIYAVGGNAEAARRAGVNVKLIRIAVFGVSGFAAGVAGIMYISQLQSMSTSLDGGQTVLYAIAAAVIGGTSLFGGRGKPIHAVLGGLVIAAIYNGLGLVNISAPAQLIVTGCVLLAAVTVDALARRGRAASGVV
jgi:D-xylose transport system permease protein